MKVCKIKSFLSKPIILVILSFIILNTYIGIKYYIKESYNDNFIRLHVVANSNNTEDQIIKLKIDEKINEYITNLNFNNNLSQKEAMDILNNNYDKILKIAQDVLKEENIIYDLKLEIGKIYYDEKQSINYDMKKGTYDSVKLILGKGEGKNIWSLIFPNKENLDKLKGYNTILPGINTIYGKNDDNEKVEYGIKCFEIIENIFN